MKVEVQGFTVTVFVSPTVMVVVRTGAVAVEVGAVLVTADAVNVVVASVDEMLPATTVVVVVTVVVEVSEVRKHAQALLTVCEIPFWLHPEVNSAGIVIAACLLARFDATNGVSVA